MISKYYDKKMGKVCIYLKHFNVFSPKDVCFDNLLETFRQSFQSYFEEELGDFLHSPCTLTT